MINNRAEYLTIYSLAVGAVRDDELECEKMAWWLFKDKAIADCMFQYFEWPLRTSISVFGDNVSIKSAIFQFSLEILPGRTGSIRIPTSKV